MLSKTLQTSTEQYKNLFDQLCKQTGQYPSGLHFHSAHIKPGYIFVAIHGTQADGHDYIQQAIHNGAIGVVGQQECCALPVPYVQVQNSRTALGQLAADFYKNPAEKRVMIGITGTNGKTTTAYMTRHLLQQAGLSAALFGTVQHTINGDSMQSNQTTPNALQLQKWLAESKDQSAVMEVSSHGLHQSRIAGIHFDFAVFMNLTHDHLDYHANIEEYFSAKAKLFHCLKKHGQAIINSSDPWGKRLINMLKQNDQPVYTFGQQATDHIQFIHQTAEWSSTVTLIDRLDQADKVTHLQLPFPGLHNAWNVMAAYTLARLMNIDAAQIRESMPAFTGIPGRLEKYIHPLGAVFIVDYAHTPDGLKYIFETIRQHCTGKLIHVLSFRLKRDPYKSEQMLQLSKLYSDEIILTADDHLAHTFEQSCQEIQSLATQYRLQHMEKDRSLAIGHAWQKVGPQDWVLITGRGPEKYKQPCALQTDSDQQTIQYLQHSQ